MIRVSFLSMYKTANNTTAKSLIKPDRLNFIMHAAYEIDAALRQQADMSTATGVMPFFQGTMKFKFIAS